MFPLFFSIFIQLLFLTSFHYLLLLFSLFSFARWTTANNTCQHLVNRFTWHATLTLWVGWILSVRTSRAQYHWTRPNRVTKTSDSSVYGTENTICIFHHSSFVVSYSTHNLKLNLTLCERGIQMSHILCFARHKTPAHLNWSAKAACERSLTQCRVDNLKFQYFVNWKKWICGRVRRAWVQRLSVELSAVLL